MLKIKFTLFFCLISILGFTAGTGANEVIKIATLDWEPYIGQNLKSEGFLAEITREAFKRSGYTVEYVFLPWKRAVLKAENGDYDGYFPAYWSKEREDKSIYTDVISSGPVGFFKVKGRDISFSTLKDLTPYKIGVVRGFVNTPEFDTASYLNKSEVTSDIQNIKKLLKERVDLIVADKFVGFYLLNKYLPHMVGQMEFLSPPLQDKKLYICMSKKTSRPHEKVAAFNKGLNEIINDGTFEEIMMKHNF